MRQFEDAHRRKQERGRQAAPKQVEGGIALRDVPECPRNDRNPLKRMPVRPHRRLGTSATRDVSKRLRAHYCPRTILQLHSIERNASTATGCPSEVDACLTLASGGHGMIFARSTRGRRDAASQTMGRSGKKSPSSKQLAFIERDSDAHALLVPRAWDVHARASRACSGMLTLGQAQSLKLAHKRTHG
jgi:hypothetical protein